MPKIEEWVDRPQRTVRADKLHERLQLLGFTGDERTTRRAVARAKERWRAGHRRTYRPWIAEPGLWSQFDWGWGRKCLARAVQASARRCCSARDWRGPASGW